MVCKLIYANESMQIQWYANESKAEQKLPMNKMN